MNAEPLAAGILVRPARAQDLAAIVACIADDQGGDHGDLWSDKTRRSYEAAFREIAESPRDVLIVGVADGTVVGVAQLTFGRVIADRGALTAQLRTVFVRKAWRGRKVGEAMVGEAERLARERGALALSLVSNKKRGDAHRFYERLGYANSHEGFKKTL